jgi:hypothetical protein
MNRTAGAVTHGSHENDRVQESLEPLPAIRLQPLMDQRQFATLLIGGAEGERTAEREYAFDLVERVGQVVVQVVARF